MDKIYVDERKCNNDNFKDFNVFYKYGLLLFELLKILWDDSDLNFYKCNFVEYMKYFYMLVELKLGLWYVLCMNK